MKGPDQAIELALSRGSSETISFLFRRMTQIALEQQAQAMASAVAAFRLAAA